MPSMRALSLALAYCLTARAVPGPHRPSRPKWELGLQVFDYFEEPGPPPAQPPPPLAPKSTVTPCRPKICRKAPAEFTSCCRHLFPGSSSGPSVVQTPNRDLVCRPAMCRTHGHSQTAGECRRRRKGRQTQTQSGFASIFPTSAAFVSNLIGKMPR